jgi:hypothetical protein
MKDEERDRFAEELLEAGLARYRRAEPHEGLEGRLLARLEESQHSRVRLVMSQGAVSAFLLRWAWRRFRTGAVAAVLCVALVGVVATLLRIAGRHRPAATRSGTPNYAAELTPFGTSKPRPGRGSTRVERPAPPRPALLSQRVARPKSQSELRPRSLPQWTEEPRQEQFPAPAPLSQQERLLLSYVRGTPSPEPLSFHDPEQLKRDLQPKPLEPLKMEPPDGKTK